MTLSATPTVSVIVPNYNHARYLRRRIGSIAAQTYRDFELILLDDCSTDDSREILASYAGEFNTRVEFNSENSGGVFKQWNKGVQMARGRYIWIAESDDYADNGFLARMVPILESQAKVAFVYCRSRTIGEDDQILGYADGYLDRLDSNHWKSDFVVDGLQEYRQFFTLCDPIPNTSAVLFRRQVYEEVGRADEGFHMCGDYKMWAAMAMVGRIAYVVEPLNFYRAHVENVRTRTRADALGVCEYFHVMLSIVDRMAAGGAHPPKKPEDGILAAQPSKLNPRQRIEAAKRSLELIADWNIQNNAHVSRDAMQDYFTDWNFALVGQEFAIWAPSRWQFFIHRFRYYRQYFRRMGWKEKLVNLMRLLGAPIVGYRHRHWPEKTIAMVRVWRAQSDATET